MFNKMVILSIFVITFHTLVDLIETILPCSLDIFLQYDPYMPILHIHCKLCKAYYNRSYKL